MPVYEAGRWPSGEPFYAMKLVAGRSLRRTSRERRSLAERLALLPHVIAVAEAIAYAHSQRIIHRDLKPANVHASAPSARPWSSTGAWPRTCAPRADAERRDGRRARGRRRAAQTVEPARSWARRPTCRPSRPRGERVDERADVYALGAILYHVLAGAPPYAGGSAGEVLAAVAAPGAAAAAPSCAPRVPRDLAAIVGKAMARGAGGALPDARASWPPTSAASRPASWSAPTATRALAAGGAGCAATARRSPVAAVAAAPRWPPPARSACARIVGERDRPAPSATAEASPAPTPTRRTDELILLQAESALAADPTEAVAWLKEYPEDGPDTAQVVRIASEAASRGVAKHVYRAGSAVRAVSSSPDGQHEAIAATVGPIRIWDTVTGDVRLLGSEGEGTAGALAYSSDGKTLAVSRSSGEVDLYDLSDGARRKINGPVTAIRHLRFARERNRLFALSDTEVWAWNLETGEGRSILRDQGVARVVISPDDQFVAAGRGGQMVLYETLRPFDPPLPIANDASVAVAFSPDGAKAVFTRGTKVETLDIATGERQVAPDEYPALRDVAYSPDGRFVAASLATGVFVLDAQSLRKMTACTPVSVAGYAGIRFSPDSRWVVTVTTSNGIDLCGTKGGESHSFLGHRGNISAIAFTTRGDLISASDDGSVRMWSLPRPSGEVLYGHSGAVLTLRISEDGRYLALTSADRTARLWSLDTRRSSIVARCRDYCSVAFVGDDRLAIADGREPRLRLLHIGAGFDGDGQPAGEFSSTPAIRQPTLVGSSPDGRTLAVLGSGADGALEATLVDLLTMTTRQLERAPALPCPRPWGKAGPWFSPDGAWLATASESAVLVWSVPTGELHEIKGHSSDVEALSWSPGGELLGSVGDDGTLRTWNPRTGVSRLVESRGLSLMSLAYSPDGGLLAVGGADPVIRVLDPAGTEVRSLVGHEGTVHAMAFAPNGALASASWDGSVRVWNPSTGSSRTLLGHSGPVVALAFGRGGQLLTSAGHDGTIRVWMVPKALDAPSRQARSRWLEALTDATVADQPTSK